MKKYVAEFIGTFALVFCGTGAIVINEVSDGMVTHTGIAITFGFIVAAMIYSVGEISGAHLNPAVSVAFLASKQFPAKDLAPYLAAQLSGALSASMVLKLLFPQNEMLGSTQPAGSVLQSFILEFILTFILMLVILSVSRGSKETGMVAGLAIGFVVLLEAQFAGPISGASMNPARSLAPAMLTGHLENSWIYIFAPVSGALAAVPLRSYLTGKSR